NARHLSNLIDDVLDLSQVDAGRMGLTKERVPLSTVAGEAISAVNRLYEVRGLTLTNRVSEDLPAVYVDRTRIRQVLINLLANAARFTTTGGAWITALLRDGNIVVQVVDTGVGIAPEDIPKAFEEFRQLDGTTRRQHDGSGLGLAICRRFVELHGGSIWAESKPGRGTIFSFTLPLIDNVASSTLRPDWDTWVRVQSISDESTRAVVLVNQDPRVERLFQRYLDGYRILPAVDEAEALRLFGQTPVHGVLLVTTPGTPLTERIQKLRAAPRNVPVIVCSLPSSTSMGASIGVTDYLIKPISADRLLDTLSRVGKKAHTVLIVDDDPEMVRLLALMIRSRSRRFQVLRAYGGAAALAMLCEHTPDIVILDLVMPEIDGYTVLREMRSSETLREVPVIAVTARSYEAEMFSAGALEISREGGLSVGEMMACLKSSLDSITTRAGNGAAPTPAGVR
ncbi:MAG TPA: ATP-binding protein, partial [Chloroflexota bacterium]|nr:ATP-binding protein [Chloroflexota bacterium]